MPAAPTAVKTHSRPPPLSLFWPRSKLYLASDAAAAAVLERWRPAARAARRGRLDGKLHHIGAKARRESRRNSPQSRAATPARSPGNLRPTAGGVPKPTPPFALPLFIPLSPSRPSSGSS